MRNITIKNVKYSGFASHETHCFEATVYVDGKRFCIASNDGQGGCDFYNSVKGGPSQSEVNHTMSIIDAELLDEFGSETSDCNPANVLRARLEFLHDQGDAGVYADAWKGNNDDLLREFAWVMSDDIDSRVDWPKSCSKTFTMQNKKFEYVICDLINDWLIDRDIKKDLRSRVLWTKKGADGIYRTAPAPNKSTLQKWIDEINKRDDTVQVVNLMAPAEARELFREHA